MKKSLPVFLFILLFGLLLAGCLGGIPPVSGNTTNGGTTPPSGGTTPPSSKVDKVTIDFLYADWCPHCQKMKPIVTDLINTLPASKFQVNYWSEEDYKAGGPSVAVFNKYSSSGIFEGYPTFVVNNGTDHLAGEVTAEKFKTWVCSQYTEKPQGC